MAETTVVDASAFVEVAETVTAGLYATRESIKKLSTQVDLDTKNGISLLSLKHHVMLSYLQALALLSAHRILGHSLGDRGTVAAQETFSSVGRQARGSQPGDLVDSMIEKRIVLEKVKVLENKMRYQIQKLVRLAEESKPEADKDIVNDPLAFRPNPQALMNQHEMSDGDGGDSGDDNGDGDGIYRPPKLAPVPYIEGASGKKDKKDRKRPIPTSLAHLAGHLDPHMEATSGLGGGAPSLQSARARELARMQEYEEENFTRLVMKKKDARARRRDEEDIALGGTGMSSGGRHRRGTVGGGFEDEFDDVLKNVNRKRTSTAGDGYDELRQRGKQGSTLARSRLRTSEEMVDDGPRERKKGRFESARMSLKKKTNGRKSR